jgi:hypothetical protein
MFAMGEATFDDPHVVPVAPTHVPPTHPAATGEAESSPLFYYFSKPSRRATISTDPERALAPHRSDLRAGRALGDGGAGSIGIDASDPHHPNTAPSISTSPPPST